MTFRPKKKIPGPRRPRTGDGEAIVVVQKGALDSLDRACKGSGLSVSREFLLTALCHAGAVFMGSKKKSHVAIRDFFLRAMAETVLEKLGDDGDGDGAGPREPQDLMSPADVRRVVHETLDDMASYLSQLSDHDPQAAVGEIHRIRQAVGPVMPPREERLVTRPGFDGRA